MDRGYLSNISDMVISNNSQRWTENPYSDVIDGLINIVNPMFCVFGILGNIFNIVIFTRRKRTSFVTHGEMEAVAYTGLIALAVSDMFYCSVSLSDTLFSDYTRLVYENTNRLPQLVFQYCSRYLQNVFTYTSTWLTVVMAINRYLAICRPINARAFMNRHILIGAIIIVFISWVLLLIPELMTSHLQRMTENSSECNQTVTKVYYVFTQTSLSGVYIVLYNVLGFVLPVVIMIFCNARIVRALHRARRMRAEFVLRAGTEMQGNLSIPNRPLTYTLVIVVLMFLILVSPSEVVWLVNRFLDPEDIKCCHPQITLALHISNVMNTLNFATNFLLYCIVNVHFRRTLMGMVCRLRSQRSSSNDIDTCVVINGYRCVRTMDTDTHIPLRNMKDQYA